jgi:hypothetical protein
MKHYVNFMRIKFNFTRLGDLWIYVDPFFIGGTIRFFGPKHSEKL